MNILEFALRLGLEISPVQTVVLKCLYGIPLDDRLTFPLVNLQGVTVSITEQEYLRKLYLEGRSNIERVSAPSRVAVLSLGRRSGKSILASLIAVFETYCKIRAGVKSPTETQTVRVYDTKLDAMQATGRILEDYFNRDPVLLKHLVAPSKWRSVWIFRDAHKNPVVNVGQDTSQANKVRGYGHNATMILSEMAYFKEDFVWEEYWGLHAKTIALSSPKWDCAFHRLYTHKNTDLALSIPTWEMNPSVPLDFLRESLDRDPQVFRSEFGAEFVTHQKAACCPHCGK